MSNSLYDTALAKYREHIDSVQVGDAWFARIGKDLAVVTVIITDKTDKTVEFRYNKMPAYAPRRYLFEDVQFIEKAKI